MDVDGKAIEVLPVPTTAGKGPVTIQYEVIPVADHDYTIVTTQVDAWTISILLCVFKVGEYMYVGTCYNFV